MEKGAIASVLTLSMSLLVIFSTFSPVLAHLGPHVDSGWASTTPTVNGAFGAGEWSDATVLDLTFAMRTRTDGSLNRTLNGKLYVKNDWNNLYVAVQIFNDDYEAQDFANKWNGFAILFDDANDGSISAGENGEGITTWVGSPFYAHNDLYYDGTGSWTADFFAGRTDDGALGWSHTNPVQGAIGNWTFEMRIPLVGTDGDSYDFAIGSLPRTIGYKLWFQEPNKGLDGVYPDDPMISQNINEITNGATFGDLTLHPLYNLTIQVGAGGTTDPVPSEYQYPYNTVVDVTATADPWYEFDHWELDGGDVGTANPFSVTMDQNHTLKAFFHPLYALKIETTTGGTTSPVPGTYVYPDGTHASVTATKIAGYEFDHWELDTVDVSTSNSYIVLMDANHTLKAVFVEELTVSITPTDVTIYLGSSVTFSSSIQGGTLPYSCQWYVGGSPISGATSSSFTYTPPAVGTYYVYLNVTDNRGRVAKSNTARVLVETPPVVGGYSIGFENADLSSRITCYSALIFVFAAGVSIIRHKRIPR